MNMEKQAIPGRVRWKKSGTVWHTSDITAPVATLHWMQYTTRTSGDPFEAPRTPRPSERQWISTAHKSVSSPKT